jgi:hypothetical protein
MEEIMQEYKNYYLETIRVRNDEVFMLNGYPNFYFDGHLIPMPEEFVLVEKFMKRVLSTHLLDEV